MWVADQSAEVARRISVETGQSVAGGMVEIVKGLNVSSRLIVSGVEDLVDGMRIDIKTAASPQK